MYDYIEDIIESSPPNMNGISPDPVKSKLFTVHDTSPQLGYQQAEFFHCMTARLLYAVKCARPDIQVAFAYLCTRVRELTEEDYMKLTRVIQYLRATVYLPLVIGWDDSGTLLWSIDASFAVHNDIRSHTDAMLTFGKGAVFSMSTKQKVNSLSSTAAKIIEVDDAMNFVMWVKLFIGQQVLNLPIEPVIKKLRAQPSVLQQDNTSSIRMEANGKRSSTKRTRHLNIRYFYVTNKVRSGDVVIVYHPTQKLVGDFLTKPLNGTPFKNHRNTIMGLTDGDVIYYKVKYEQEKAAYIKRIGYERDVTSSSNIQMIEADVGVC